MHEVGQGLLRALSEGLLPLGGVDAVLSDLVLGFGDVEEGQGVAVGDSYNLTVERDGAGFSDHHNCCDRDPDSEDKAVARAAIRGTSPQSLGQSSAPRDARYHNLMKVSVKVLRRNGRRVGEYGTAAGRRIAGVLTMHSQAGAFTAATLRQGAPKDPDLLPPLYEPVLVTIGGTGFLLRGFESNDGATYMQEWHCEVA